MANVQQLCAYLEEFAPRSLAEDWDNVGLLVGDPSQPVRRVMTCLTVTPASVREAVEEGVEMIVSHHPMPFRPLKRLTTETTPGRLLLQLIRAGIAVYSPHTAFDSAGAGINHRLAAGLGLSEITPLVPQSEDAADLGTGRCGRLKPASTQAAFSDRVKAFLKLAHLQVVGPPDRELSRVAVACGAAGELLSAAVSAGCDAMVLGETNFHTCLEAEALGVSLLLTGHYASERFAVERLADAMQEPFPELTIWASRRESDPLAWV
jgi:dinuclear metal center YbgI/SA1388 family protein